MLSYKNIADDNAHSFILEYFSENQDQIDSVENQCQLEQICSRDSISSLNDLKILYNYCKKSYIDDFGVNIFLFRLAFCRNSNEIDDFNIIHILMETVQFSSFNPEFFINAECINCLINHIFNRTLLSKYALIFFVNLLYKTNKRMFLRETNFFNMFQISEEYQKENEQLNLENLLFAFFSQTEEIDQEMFNDLNQYTSQYIFSSTDIHQIYRYLVMILSLAEKNIRIENIDALISNSLDFKEDFMVEIILFLIQFSDNPQNFFDYIIYNFENKFTNNSIILASIRTFYYCWKSFNNEQKTSISKIISSNITKVPYSLRLSFVSFICNIESWDIFNDIIFFDEILNLISQKEISMKCLEAIYNILSFGIQDSQLNLQKITFLISHLDDLKQIADSTEEPENQIAQMLVNAINEAIEDKDDT